MRPLGLFAFIAGGIGLLFSCDRKQEQDLPEVSLKEEMSIDAFSDSTYFSDVWSMVEADGDLYLCETRRRQIVRLDARTLSLRNTVGESGEGPENTFYVQYVQVWGDTVLAADPVKQRMQYFDRQGHYLYSDDRFFERPIGGGNFVYLGNGRFVFSASLKRPEAVVEIDRVDTASCRYFGRKRYADGDWLKARKDSRRIFRQGENIVAYSNEGCFVEKYDPDGRLVDMYDFRQDQLLKGQIKRAEQKEEEERARGQAVVVTVAKEAYLYGDCLYVLFFDREGESVSCNRVLVLDVSGEKIIPKNVYRLTGGNFYVSLCADDRYLYAFCCSPEVKIQKFSL